MLIQQISSSLFYLFTRYQSSFPNPRCNKGETHRSTNDYACPAMCLFYPRACNSHIFACLLSPSLFMIFSISPSPSSPIYLYYLVYLHKSIHCLGENQSHRLLLFQALTPSKLPWIGAIKECYYSLFQPLGPLTPLLYLFVIIAALVGSRFLLCAFCRQPIVLPAVGLFYHSIRHLDAGACQDASIAFHTIVAYRRLVSSSCRICMPSHRLLFLHVLPSSRSGLLSSPPTGALATANACCSSHHHIGQS